MRLALIFTILLGISNPTPLPQSSGTTAKPDFSGTWNARILQPPPLMVEVLRCSFRDHQLKIVRFFAKPSKIVVGQPLRPETQGFDRVYYTDGRGESNPPLFLQLGIRSSEIKSKTIRSGGKFVINSSLNSKISGQTVRDIEVTLEVASDANSLTVTLAEGNLKKETLRYERHGPIGDDINGDWVQPQDSPIHTLIIEHSDPQIKVTTRVISKAGEQTDTAIYFTDGRGETNIRDGLPVKSKTRWDKDRLVVEESRSSSQLLSSSQLKWQISPDHMSLIEEKSGRWKPLNGSVREPDSEFRRLIYARSSPKLPTVN